MSLARTINLNLATFGPARSSIMPAWLLALEARSLLTKPLILILSDLQHVIMHGVCPIPKVH